MEQQWVLRALQSYATVTAHMSMHKNTLAEGHNISSYALV